MGMFWIMFWIVIIGAGVWFVKRNTEKGKQRVEAFLKFAEDNNFKVDYHYHSMVAIDATTKSLILSSDQVNYKIYPVSNIVHMEKYDATSGKRRGNLAAYQIKFITKSLETPQVFVPFINDVDRNLWYDRINALWSGGK